MTQVIQTINTDSISDFQELANRLAMDGYRMFSFETMLPNGSSRYRYVAVMVKEVPEDRYWGDIDPKTGIAYGLSYQPGYGNRYHIVKAGETLANISNRYYANSDKWYLIYHANETVIGMDPHILRVGMRLLIPHMEAPLPNKGPQDDPNWKGRESGA